MRFTSHSALNNPPRLTVYSRAYCHLCSEMIAGLRAMQAARRFDLQIIDVDADALLVARYGEWVPVLAGMDGELCHYHLDPAKVNEYLNSH